MVPASMAQELAVIAFQQTSCAFPPPAGWTPGATAEAINEHLPSCCRLKKLVLVSTIGRYFQKQSRIGLANLDRNREFALMFSTR